MTKSLALAFAVVALSASAALAAPAAARTSASQKYIAAASASTPYLNGAGGSQWLNTLNYQDGQLLTPAVRAARGADPSCAVCALANETGAGG